MIIIGKIVKREKQFRTAVTSLKSTSTSWKGKREMAILRLKLNMLSFVSQSLNMFWPYYPICTKIEF